MLNIDVIVLPKKNMMKRLIKSNNWKLANINEILCPSQSKNRQIERFKLLNEDFSCFWPHFGENFAPIL